jgi:hypothetical protein
MIGPCQSIVLSEPKQAIGGVPRSQPERAMRKAPEPVARRRLPSYGRLVPPPTAPMLSRTTLSLLPLAAAAALLALACHREEQSKTAEPPPDPPEVAEIVEWLVGEQVRAPKTQNRSLGIVTIDLLDAKSLGDGTLQPGSCAASLASIIPIPGTTDEWLGADETSTLYRYAGQRWIPMPTRVDLVPMAKLLAVAKVAGGLLLLIHKKGDNEQLWQLTLTGSMITKIQRVDRTGFSTRRATLEIYDSRRCLEGVLDCLHLTSIGKDVVLSREPETYAFWETIMELGDTGARDVRYMDKEGKKVGVLVAAPCEPPAPATPPATAPAAPGVISPTAEEKPSDLVPSAPPSASRKPKRRK